jgi:AcrR family transcriptional regulator
LNVMSVAVLQDPQTETRRKIVDIAERLFREIGYQKTTVADIAKALRMSSANVYRFFDSKKSINQAVAERTMGEIEAELSRIAEGAGPAAERFRKVARTYHRLNAERYTADLRMHEMVACAMTESWEVVSNHIERVDEIYRRIVADGVAKGEFAVANIDVATRCAHVAMVRFCHPGLIVQCADQPGPSLDQMIEFVLAGLGHRLERKRTARSLQAPHSGRPAKRR